jgi:tetratricopeptide (TPR) repeat protein
MEEKKRNIPLVFKRTLQLAIVIIAALLENYFRGFFVGDVHHNIAIFHSKRGEWSRALENYNIVTEKNPGFIMAHYFMGNVFNDRWINSRELHPEWGDKETDEPWTMIDSGKNGRVDPERSISKYRDVWEIAPDYVQSFHQAGLLYLKLGGEAKSKGDMAKANEYWKEAINLFEKYHKIDPIFPPNYYRLAWVYTQLGDMKKTEETYLRHIYTMDMFRNGKEEMKWVYEQLGEPLPEDIRECEIHRGKYHSLLREDWGSRRRLEYSETFVNLGNLRFLAKDPAKAEQYYSEALKLNPDNINGLKNFAVLYARTGNHDKALSLWQRVRSLNPDDPDVKKVFSK